MILDNIAVSLFVNILVEYTNTVWETVTCASVAWTPMTWEPVT